MIDRYYFIGIGGIGMSSLAKYLFYKGNLVSGYDKTKGFITEELNEEGIQVVYKDSIEAIPEKFKLKGTKIIYTPAIPNDNIQLNYFIHNDFEVKKRSYLLGNITKDSKVFAIAGTHGKTTTSAILCHMCNSIKLNFTAFLGGIANGFNSNLISNGNEFSIVEADEYDRSFLELYPTFSCITSMDADHLDIYGNKSNLVEAFKEFSKRTKKHLLVAKGLPIKGITFSLDQKADYYATNILQNNLGYKFDFHTPSSIYRNIEFNIIGRYNLLNAIAASAMIDLAEIPLNDALNSLKYFKGLKRRIEIFEIGGKVIIDDYAHHPTEINSILEGVHNVNPTRKIISVFEPHRYSRVLFLNKEFSKCFSKSNVVIVCPLYAAGEKKNLKFDLLKFAGSIAKNSKTQVIIVKNEIDLSKYLKKNLISNEIIIGMGAGIISKWIANLKSSL